MKNKDKDIREIMNPLGILFVCLSVFAVFIGFAAPYLAPNSYLGERMDSSFAKLIYMGIVIVIAYIVEIVLKHFGINLLRK